MSYAGGMRRKDPLWKLYFVSWCSGLGLLMAATGFILFPIFSLVWGAVFMLVGLHLVLGSIVFAFLAIRCPGCRAGALLNLENKGRDRDANLSRPITVLDKLYVRLDILSRVFRMPKLSRCPICTENSGEEPSIHDTWAVEQTGQLWKIPVAILGILVGIWMVVIPLVALGKTSLLSICEGALLLIGVHLLMGSIVFLILSVRCPVCHRRWLWGDSKPRTERGVASLVHLLTFSECPRCGDGKGSDEKSLASLSA
jgi:hypothetical protein